MCVCVDHVKKKKTDLKMDVRDMKAFGDASFDAVIDKGIMFLIISIVVCFM